MSDELSGFLFFLAIVAVVLIPFLLANKFDTMRRNTKLADLAAAIGGSFKGQTVTGNFFGHPAGFTFLEGSEQTYARLLITLERGFPCRLVIRKEKLSDRIAKKTGLVVETQTGLETFDNDYFIDTGDSGWAKTFLLSAETRANIISIFGNTGVSEIYMGGNSIIITINKCVPVSKTISGSIAKKILESVNRLGDAAGAVKTIAPASNIPRDAFSTSIMAKPANPAEFARWSKIIHWTAFGLAVSGIILLYFSDRWKSLNPWLPLESLYVSLPALTAFPTLAFLKLRGTASSGREFQRILFPSAAGFIFLCYAGTLYTNQVLDSGPRTDHQAAVIETKKHHTKGGSVYFMVLPSWNGNGNTQYVRINNDFYTRIKKGNRVNIRTKPGYLGHEWVVYYKKLP